MEPDEEVLLPHAGQCIPELRLWVSAGQRGMRISGMDLQAGALICIEDLEEQREGPV